MALAPKVGAVDADVSVDRTTRNGLWVVLVAAVVVTTFVIDAHWRGALGIPRNDEWSYIRTAFLFDDAGRFELNGYASVTLIGQTLMSAPIVAIFGQSITVLQVFTALAAVAAIWVWFGLARMFLPAWAAVAAMTALVAGPMFGILAVSYMGDIPALLLQGVALRVGVRAVEDRSRAPEWLAMAAVPGFVAFAFREYAIVGFATVGLVVLANEVRHRGRVRSVLVLGVVFVAAAAVLFVWRHEVVSHDNQIANEVQSLDRIGFAGSRALLNIAFLVAPALAFLSPIRVVRAALSASRVGTGAALLTVAAVVVLADGDVFSGGYISRIGGSSLDGGAPIWLMPMVWNACAAVSVYGVAILALLAVASRRWWMSAAERIVAVFAWLHMLLFLAVIGATPEFFDRYLLPGVPAIAAVILSLALREGLVACGRGLFYGAGAASIYALASLIFLDSIATYEGARWGLAHEAVQRGADPATIDAGVEWVGLHQDVVAEADAVVSGREWWTAMFPGPFCYTVTSSPGHREVIAVADTHSLPFGPQQMALVAGPDHCRRGRVRGRWLRDG